MKIEERIVIARDTEDLWAFFMDIQNLPKWDRSVARVQSPDSVPLTSTRRLPAPASSGSRSWHFSLEATAVTCVSDFSLRARHLWLAPPRRFP